MNLPLMHRLALGAFGSVLFVLGWLWLSAGSANLFFPPLQVMLADAFAYWGSAQGLRDIGSTLANLGAGLLLGTLVGTLCGLLIGQVAWLDRAFTPLIEFVRSVPQVALMPFAISLFGIGDAMKVFIIALSTFWPVLLNVNEGVRQIPRQWQDTAWAFALSRRQRQLYIVLPAVLPRLLTGVHVALPLSLIVAVTSEMIGSNTGIGSVILNAQYTYEITRMWSGVLVLGAIGCVLNVLFGLLERSLHGWQSTY